MNFQEKLKQTTEKYNQEQIVNDSSKIFAECMKAAEKGYSNYRVPNMNDLTRKALEQEGLTIKLYEQAADPKCNCHFMDNCNCGAYRYFIVSW